jgi:hypothetical protein
MRIRTADILLAKQTLYQLSYTPFQGGANDKEKRLNCALRYSTAQIFLVVFRCKLFRTCNPLHFSFSAFQRFSFYSKGSTYRSDGFVRDRVQFTP